MKDALLPVQILTACQLALVPAAACMLESTSHQCNAMQGGLPALPWPGKLPASGASSYMRRRVGMHGTGLEPTKPHLEADALNGGVDEVAVGAAQNVVKEYGTSRLRLWASACGQLLDLHARLCLQELGR